MGTAASLSSTSSAVSSVSCVPGLPAAPALPAVAAARAPLKSLNEALAELLAHAQGSSGTEQVSTFDADGRVLAQDVISSLHVPPHDNSSMDGYALRCAALTWRRRA